MKIGRKVAFAGVICALSLVFMLLTVIPVMEISLPVIAGIILIVLVIELDIKWGFLGYIAVALLSMLLAPSFESRILFAVFFGYYPTLKALIERIRFSVLGWIIKFVLFNIAIGGAYYLLLRLTTMLDPNDFTVFGMYLPGVILLFGNIVFVLYDIALTRVISAYIHTWQPKLHKMLRF